MTAKREWGYKTSELKRLWENKVEIKEIARILKVPPAAVDKERRRLKLEPRRTIKREKRLTDWQKREDVILRREWELGTPIKTIAGMLPNRTISATFARVETLNLKKRKAQGNRSKQVRMILPVSLLSELSKRASKRGITRSNYLRLIFQHFVDGGFELPRFMISTNALNGSWRHMAALHAEKGHSRKDTIDFLVLHGASINVAGNAVRWIDENGWVWPLAAVA